MRCKYIDKIRGYLKRTPVASMSSISVLVPNRSYVHLIMNYLVKRGEIRRISKGYYTTREEPSLLVYCMRPAYIGMQDAMSFHGLWEQETNPVIITTRKVRPGVRRVFGQNVWVRRISPKYFFGYEYLASDGFLLPVSDVEKTFIDMIYFREMREDIAKEFRKRVNREKLEKYLKMYNTNFRRKVIEILR